MDTTTTVQVRGRVRAAEGGALPADVQVRVWRAAIDPDTLEIAVAPSGELQAVTLPAGLWVLEASAPDRVPLHCIAQSNTGGHWFDLPLFLDSDHPQLDLFGRVEDPAGNGIPGARIRFWGPKGELPGVSVVTDATGDWQMEIREDRLPIVPFRLSAEGTGYLTRFLGDVPSPLLSEPLHPIGDTILRGLDFVLPPVNPLAAWTGQVETGDSTRAVVVGLRREGQVEACAITDEAGFFTLWTEEPDSLVLLGLAAEHAPEFSGGGADLDLAQPLAPGSSHLSTLTPLPAPEQDLAVQGRVLDETGEAVVGALVVAQSSGEVLRWSASGPGGIFQLDSLSAGTVELVVSQAGHASGHLQVDLDGARRILPEIVVVAPRRESVDVEPALPRPSSARLLANQPNPFNPRTWLRFELPQPGPVSLEVFDLRGARVWRWSAPLAAAGLHAVPFDGSSLAAGLYLVRLEAAGTLTSNRILLLK